MTDILPPCPWCKEEMEPELLSRGEVFGIYACVCPNCGAQSPSVLTSKQTLEARADAIRAATLKED